MNDVLTGLRTFWAGFPPLSAAALVLAFGWTLAFGSRIAVSKGLKLLHFGAFSERIGMTEFLRKGGSRYSPVQLIGVFVYWVILVIAFLLISKLLDFTIVQEFTERIRVILPSAIAALFIIIVGMVIVSFLATFALTLARNAAIRNAQTISTTIKYLGIAIVVLAALDQVGFGKTILGPMMLMLFGGLVFGLALAFGLGCKDIARQAAEQFLRDLRERERCAKGPDLEG